MPKETIIELAPETAIPGMPTLQDFKDLQKKVLEMQARYYEIVGDRAAREESERQQKMEHEKSSRKANAQVHKQMERQTQMFQDQVCRHVRMGDGMVQGTAMVGMRSAENPSKIRIWCMRCMKEDIGTMMELRQRWGELTPPDGIIGGAVPGGE